MSMIKLRELVPAAQNNVSTQFIVVEKGGAAAAEEIRKERTCVAVVADETATVDFQMWGEECEAFEVGDIVRLTNGIFSLLNDRLLLRAGRKGNAIKVGEFCMVFVETPNMSDPQLFSNLKHKTSLPP